jgi:glutamine amidotransferase PdxT
MLEYNARRDLISIQIYKYGDQMLSYELNIEFKSISMFLIRAPLVAHSSIPMFAVITHEY